MKPAYRHEWKFLLTTAEYCQLRSVLQAVMGQDIHAGPQGGYHIRSLYLDDIYRTAYRQKLEGVQLRKKYRVRVYNCSDTHIALECKYKNGAYVHKQTVPLTRAEYERFLAGDYTFLLRKPQPLAAQFYLDARAMVLRPCVTVAYDREAFVNDVGTVRITFDRALCAMTARQDLFDPAAPAYHVLDPGQLILEVKYTGILPEYIQSIFSAYSFVRTSASKFCLCVDRIHHVLR